MSAEATSGARHLSRPPKPCPVPGVGRGDRSPVQAAHAAPITIPVVSNSRLVYSTADGDRRQAQSTRKAASAGSGPQLPNDGVVRIFRDRSGRGGKIVTVVRGLPAADAPAVASELKRLCGSGGAAKAGVVEIQGDHREKIAGRLEAQGYRVKLAGG